MNATATLPALHAAHLEYLKVRGITEAAILAHGFESARPQDLARLAGGPVPDGTSGLVIPYDGADGFCRVRLFPPIPRAEGKAQKFGQPASSSVRAYIPGGVRDLLADPERSLSITEGEIKALALTQAGFPTIALGGVWNFRTKDLPDDSLIPDLEAVTWAGRVVYLVPDSDAWTNEQVLHAVYRLARLLEARGATVLHIRLPNLAGQDKTGADDYLVSKGAAAFRRLVENAVTLGHPAFKPWREREKAQAREAAKAEAQTQTVETIELWPDAVDGDMLLQDIVKVIQRFVVLSAEAARAVALWCVAAHSLEPWDVFPMLGITSPTKRCGKTTLLGVIRCLIPRPLAASNISPAAIYRAVQAWKPTLLTDEVDTFLRDNDELRGVLNSGHSRTTAFVVRVEGEGDNRQPQRFSTWCPKVVACIGSLPPTLTDRSIVIALRRRAKHEPVTRARRRTLGSLGELARKAARWMADSLEGLSFADPTIPGTLDDRAADNWEPLFAVADLAGGSWPEMARKAAIALSGGRDTVDEEKGIQLLQNIKDVFDAKNFEHIASCELVAALIAEEEWPWVTYRKNDKPLNQHILARLLKPFGIGPKKIRVGDGTIRGYERKSLFEPWAHYLGFRVEQVEQINGDEQLGPLFEPEQTAGVPVEKTNATTGKERIVPLVPLQTPENGGVMEI